jgi:peptide-methionine (S)-S-oxide reductase
MRRPTRKALWLWGCLLAAASAIGGTAALLGTAGSGQDVPRAAAPPVPEGMEVATLGGGCFWCTEAIFLQLRGVHSVVSGYSGGHVADPTYREVCSGTTGHAEVVRVVFDPQVISYVELLAAFWQSHDPTTKDRQGHDVGPQYRSVIFTHSDQQRQEAEHYKQRLEQSGAFRAPIVTQIEPAVEFYPAELYHQNYFAEHGRQPYCARVIAPKLEKFKQAFADKMKTAPVAAD